MRAAAAAGIPCYARKRGGTRPKHKTDIREKRSATAMFVVHI